MRILLLTSDRKNYRYNHLEFNVTLETSLVQFQQHNIFKHWEVLWQNIDTFQGLFHSKTFLKSRSEKVNK